MQPVGRRGGGRRCVHRLHSCRERHLILLHCLPTHVRKLQAGCPTQPPSDYTRWRLPHPSFVCSGGAFPSSGQNSSESQSLPAVLSLSVGRVYKSLCSSTMKRNNSLFVREKSSAFPNLAHWHTRILGCLVTPAGFLPRTNNLG